MADLVRSLNPHYTTAARRPPLAHQAPRGNGFLSTLRNYGIDNCAPSRGSAALSIPPYIYISARLDSPGNFDAWLSITNSGSGRNGGGIVTDLSTDRPSPQLLFGHIRNTNSIRNLIVLSTTIG